MEKKKGLTRIVVCLYSNEEFGTIEDASFKLTQEVQEIENRVFAVHGTNSPQHIFINTDDLLQSYVWIYFYSEEDLEEIDNLLLEYSQDFNGDISVIDFDNGLYQSYSTGEYEEGVMNHPSNRENYRESINLNYNSENSQYPLTKFPLKLY